MNPSALVLYVCAAIFLTLFSVFAGYMLYQLKLSLSRRKKVAKEVPFYTSDINRPVKIKEPAPAYRLAQAK